jgi:amino acid transporter
MTTASGPTGAPADGELVRAVGLPGLAASIVNIIVGGGIFVLPATLALVLGPAAPLAFVLGALVMLPITACFAAAGSRVTATGGPYSYLGAAFGPFAGFIGGSLMWITNVASIAGIAAALVDQAGSAMPTLASPAARAGLLVGLYALLVIVNALGIRVGIRTIIVLAILKLAPLVMLAVGGLFFIALPNLTWQGWPAWSQIGSAMVLVIFAYAGIETALIPSGEVKDPNRLVPKAALLATVFVIALYVALQSVAQGVLGDELKGHPAPLAATAGAIWTYGFILLIATASVSMLGLMQGNLVGSSRLLYAFGRDGLLPRALGRVTETRRVPLLAILAHAGVGLGLALAGEFATLAMISGGAVCLVYIGVCAAAWRLERRGVATHGAAFALPGGPLLPIVGIVALTLVLSTLPAMQWLAIGIALAAALALYGLARVTRHA